MQKLVFLITQRLALSTLILFVVSVIIFLGVGLLPGDAATAILGNRATPETVAALRDQLGLNLPLHMRYLHWLNGVVHGDFGTSLSNGRDIATLIGSRLGNTLFLAGFTAMIAIPIAVGLGVLTALYRNSLLDRAINIFALVNISFPEFFVAYIMILVFAVHLGWLPSLSMAGSTGSLWHHLYSILLPSLTLTLIVMAHMLRMTRATIVNLLATPYVEMAVLKGLSLKRIIVRHALPNAWAPIVNVIVINLAYLVVGVVVVEVVFVYPGLGQLLVDSVTKRDIPVVQACSIIFAGVYVLLNLTADLLSIISNPRLLHPR